MNYRLNLFSWKPGKDPDREKADNLSSYHYSKYRAAYLDFIKLMGQGRSVQLHLVDLDNRSDWVIVDDSRWEVEE